MINFLLKLRELFLVGLALLLVVLNAYFKGRRDNKEKQNLKDLENDRKFYKRVIKAKTDAANASSSSKLDWMRKRFGNS